MFIYRNNDHSKAIYKKFKEILYLAMYSCFSLEVVEITKLLLHIGMVSLILNECTCFCLNTNLHLCFTSFIHAYG